jgi:PncC family amidohydrolase
LLALAIKIHLSALLTQESGASDYFDRGFITYSNQAKVELLGVKKSTLDTYGAVSEH